MKKNQLVDQTGIWTIDLNHRPTLGGEPIWDGTHHGPTDPNGPIISNRGGISNGF